MCFGTISGHRLTDCSLSPAAVAYLCPSIARLTRLEVLSLSGNAMGPLGVAAVVDALPHLSRLQELRLSAPPVPDDNYHQYLGHWRCMYSSTAVKLAQTLRLYCPRLRVLVYVPLQHVLMTFKLGPGDVRCQSIDISVSYSRALMYAYNVSLHRRREYNRHPSHVCILALDKLARVTVFLSCAS